MENLQNTGNSANAQTYTVSFADYRAAGLLAMRPTWQKAILSLLATLLFVTVVFVAVRYLSHRPMRLASLWKPVLITGISAYIVGGLLGYGIPYFKMARDYRKYPLIQKPVTVEQREEGLFFSSEQAEGLALWSQYIKWRENDKCLLLYQSPILYNVFPKRLAADGFDFDTLRAKLREHLGEPK